MHVQQWNHSHLQLHPHLLGSTCITQAWDGRSSAKHEVVHAPKHGNSSTCTTQARSKGAPVVQAWVIVCISSGICTQAWEQQYLHHSSMGQCVHCPSMGKHHPSFGRIHQPSMKWYMQPSMGTAVP